MDEIDAKLLFNYKEYKSKYKKVGVLPIRIIKSNVSSVGPSSERTTRFTLTYLDFTPTFLYFDLYLNTDYAAHYVYEEYNERMG